MKDFISTTVTTDLGQEDIFSIVNRSLPSFLWRMGDSDSQGLYISGHGENTEQMQLWLDNDLVDVTISLRNARGSDISRDEWKNKLVNKIINEVLPTIGKVGEISQTD